MPIALFGGEINNGVVKIVMKFHVADHGLVSGLLLDATRQNILKHNLIRNIDMKYPEH